MKRRITKTAMAYWWVWGFLGGTGCFAGYVLGWLPTKGGVAGIAIVVAFSLWGVGGAVPASRAKEKARTIDSVQALRPPEIVKVFGPEEPDTYPMPPDGWVCFHCGERFTTPGSAQDHFGDRPEDTAACRIKVGEERGLVMELRRNQRINRWLLEELSSPSEPCAACGLRWYEGCGH